MFGQQRLPLLAAGLGVSQLLTRRLAFLGLITKHPVVPTEVVVIIGNGRHLSMSSRWTG